MGTPVLRSLAPGKTKWSCPTEEGWLVYIAHLPLRSPCTPLQSSTTVLQNLHCLNHSYKIAGTLVFLQLSDRWFDGVPGRKHCSCA